MKENGHFLEAEMSVFLEDEFTEYFVDGYDVGGESRGRRYL